MEHACNSAFELGKAGGSKVKSHFWMHSVHSEFKDSLGYLRPCLKKKKKDTHTHTCKVSRQLHFPFNKRKVAFIVCIGLGVPQKYTRLPG